MNKLKFSKDEGSLFYKELNEKIELYFQENNLNRTGNSLMYFKIFLYFSLDFLFYCLMISSEGLVSFYVFYLLMGLSILLTAFNISHDAAHGVAVKSKFWNKLLFQLSFNLQGNNAYVWGKNHNESHHLYTNVEGSDIDVLNNPLFRMKESQPLKKYHRFQWLYAPFLYLLYSLNWFLFRETLMLINYSSRTIKVEIPLAEAVKLVVYKLLYVGYMIIIPLYLLPFGWEHVLLAFLINHFIISLIFVGVLGVSHLSDYVAHPQPDSKGRLAMSWPILQMCTSVDYNPDSLFFNWTLGGFNAHALHHLFPHIHHVHYPRLNRILYQILNENGITSNQTSYWGGIVSHLRLLKRMSCREKVKKVAA